MKATTESLVIGKGSLCATLKHVHFFKPLFHNVEVAFPSFPALDASAVPIGHLDVIEITDGSYQAISATMRSVVQSLELVHKRPWRLLGHTSRTFAFGKQFADWLASVALDLVFAHELSHVVLGHLSIVRKHGIKTQLAETSLRLALDKESGWLGKPLDRRALEVGADRGLAWFLHFMLEMLQQDTHRYGRSSERAMISSIIYALYLVFAHLECFDPGTTDSDRFAPFAPKRHHPPAMGRIQLWEQSFLSFPNTKRRRINYRAGVDLAREAVGACVGVGALPEYQYELLNHPRELKQYMNEAIDRWTLMYARVVKGSRWEDSSKLADETSGKLSIKQRQRAMRKRLRQR